VPNSAEALPRITRLTESDWELFAHVRLRALSDALGTDDTQYQQEAEFDAAQWRQRLREQAQFAAFLDDRAVGLIAAHQESADTVYLYSLWLDPAARGHGLARQLVAAALDWARRHRARTVTLRVAPENTVARAVYDSFGFAEVAGSVHDDELSMTLSVG
jgi:RimJ/RimL family protein N-acetyltransferase